MKEAPFLMILITFQVAVLSTTSSGLSISLPGCPDKCGDVSIPYPFGIGNGCAAVRMNSFFTVTCNSTFQPPRPMISDPSATYEIIDISLEHAEMRVYGPVSYNCFTSNTTVADNYTGSFSLVGTPFTASTTRNRFMVIGCSTMGLIGGYTHHSNPDLYVAGCYSYCRTGGDRKKIRWQQFRMSTCANPSRTGGDRSQCFFSCGDSIGMHVGYEISTKKAQEGEGCVF